MPSFLHAADLHLDSPLRGLEGKMVDATTARRIREASRIALTRLVDAALAEPVAFVLLAGDIYDTQPAFETSLFFLRELRRLDAAGIPTAIALGNHDHAGVAPRAERLPASARVFPTEGPGSFEIVPGVWVHGQSYAQRVVDADLSAGYPQAVPGALNIGVLHTALDGHSGEHARYAPSRSDALAAHGYRYWALGHVHRHEAFVERGCHIVYPGNLQGRHARETGPKGAVFVRWAGREIEAVEHRAFDDVRWFDLAVDAATLDPGSDVPRQVRARVEAETAAARQTGRLAAVRLRLVGAAPEALLRRGAAGLEDELRAEFDDSPVFLERIELGLHAAAAELREAQRQLERVGAALAADSPDLLEAALDRTVEALRRVGGPQLAREFREEVDRAAATPEGRAGLLLELGMPLARDALLGPRG